MEILADDCGMLSFELVEVNPILDEHNRTAELAVQLLCSASGKKIFLKRVLVALNEDESWDGTSS
jgi:arginase family enzyme